MKTAKTTETTGGLVILGHWIPVKKQLPDDDITVLMADKEGDVLMGYHDGASGWRYAEGERVSVPVTHWADVPGPPV